MNLFDIVNKKVQLSNLEKKTLEPDFWNDNKESGKVLSEIKTLKDTVSNYTKAESELINIIEMTELVMLEFSANTQVGLTCENCGVPVRSGRFCSKCKNSMANDLQGMYKKKKTMVEKKPDTKDNPRMHFLDR